MKLLLAGSILALTVACSDNDGSQLNSGDESNKAGEPASLENFLGKDVSCVVKSSSYTNPSWQDSENWHAANLVVTNTVIETFDFGDDTFKVGEELPVSFNFDYHDSELGDSNYFFDAYAELKEVNRSETTITFDAHNTPGDEFWVDGTITSVSANEIELFYDVRRMTYQGGSQDIVPEERTVVDSQILLTLSCKL